MVLTTKKTLENPLLSTQFDLEDETSVQSDSRDSISQKMSILAQDALPTISGHLVYAVTTFIYVYFVGHLNNPLLLAAVSLGQQFSNALCFAILFSLDSGFAALASQAFGAKNHHRVGIYYQKTLIVYALTAIPCTFLLWHGEKVLNFIGIENEVVKITAHYVRWMIPDFYILIINESTKNYLMAQNIFKIQYILSGISSVFACLNCLFFITYAQMGIEGIALARICTDLMMTSVLIGYIKICKPCEESWIPWAPAEIIQDLWPYFKQIFLIGFPFYVEWQSWEANVLMIGLLNNTYVMAACGAGFPIIECLWSFFAGLASTMSVYVGNAAGEGNTEKAKTFIKAGFLLNCVLIVGCFIAANILKETIAQFLVDDKEVQEILANLIMIYSIVFISDGNQINLTTILRMIGKEKVVFRSALTFQTVIGISLGYIIGVRWMNSYVGVWIGQGIGAVIMCSFMAYNLITLDWDCEVKRIHKKMITEGEEQMSIEMIGMEINK